MSVGSAPLTVDPEVARLVERARAGDAEAFAALYDRYLDQIYGYVRRRVGSREIAEDLTGDVFLRAWRRFDRFRWQGVDLGAWLTTIARNRVNDHFKSSRVRLERTVGDAGARVMASPVDAPDSVSEARELASSLAAAMAQLKDAHREILELRFVQDLSVTEAASVLGRTVGATKALQYRALRALSQVMHDTPGFESLLAGSVTRMIMLMGMLP